MAEAPENTNETPSGPICSTVASVIELANATKLAKIAIKKIVNNTADGLLDKIDLLKVLADIEIIRLKAKLLDALPAGSLKNIKGAISAIQKVDDFQRAVKRGDAAGAAIIAEEIARDFPMLGEALDNLESIDICKDLPNLIKTSEATALLGSDVTMPNPFLESLKGVVDATSKFASDAASALEETEGRKQTREDQMSLARAERRRRKVDVTIDEEGLEEALAQNNGTTATAGTTS